MVIDKTSIFGETVCQFQWVISAYECCEFMQEKVLEVKQLLQLDMQKFICIFWKNETGKRNLFEENLIPSWLYSDTQIFEITWTLFPLLVL